MPQKVDKYFGIHLELDSFIDENEYEIIKEQLADRVRTLAKEHKQKIDVYIHKLDITIKPKHLGLSPLSARLSHLDITTCIPKKASQSKKIFFVNPLPDFSIDANVQVRRLKNRITYRLSGKYCEKNKSYHDYIATMVVDGCLPRYKKLIVKAAAYPEPKLKQRIENIFVDSDNVITKLQFPLTRDIQLTFAF